MRPRRASPPRPPAPVLLGLILLAAAGCGEPASTDGERRPVPEPEAEATTTVTPARFRTEVAFVPHGDGPSAYLSLEQVARPGSLARRYRGWLDDGSGFRALLSVTDTLPVPRAAWRPLPAEGLRVVAAGDGRFRTLVWEVPSGILRLTVDSTLVDWTGRTGQPERLAAARVLRGEDTVPGLLVERRLAHPLDAPGPEPDAGLLLVAGPGPAGAVALLRTRTGDSLPTAVAAHGLVRGSARSWSAVRVARPPDDPAGWELRLGEAGPVLRIARPAGPDTVPAAVSGALRLDGTELPVSGALVPGPGG